MKCLFCDEESSVHIEIEPGHTLDLCEVHFKKLHSFLLAPSVSCTEPYFEYWVIANPQDSCQHEYDWGITAPACRKCGKPYYPNESHTILKA